LRFTGSDSDINPAGVAEPEFDAWRWVRLNELPALAADFKRPMYEALVAEFAPLLAAHGSPA
jgi:putative (di)nucleoside polyphosphate hydrolase